MKYSDLTEEQLCELADILTDRDNPFKWLMKKAKNEVMMDGSADTVFFYDDSGEIEVFDIVDSPITANNIWEFFNKCKEFGLTY